MNNATTEQPVPMQPSNRELLSGSVQHYMKIRYGGGIGKFVIEDVIKRAEKAKDKYKLDHAGCYAFNGRDALLDAYQELVDCLVYLTQYNLEAEETDSGNDPFPPFFIINVLGAAMTVRKMLENQGDFE